MRAYSLALMLNLLVLTRLPKTRRGDAPARVVAASFELITLIKGARSRFFCVTLKVTPNTLIVNFRVRITFPDVTLPYVAGIWSDYDVCNRSEN